MMLRRWNLVTIGLLCWSSAVVESAETPAPARTLKMAAVQMRSDADMEANLNKIVESIARCAKDGVRVVAFPEFAVSGYTRESVKRTAEELAAAEQRIGEACRANDVYAVVGMPSREDGRLFNSAVVFAPDGRVIERYHKIQLSDNFTDAGDHMSVFKIDGVMCTIIICHDERYPELVRLPVMVGAQVVFYISAESGIISESKIDPYRAQIQARAMENTVWVVHANPPANPDVAPNVPEWAGSHGHSRIIAPDGQIVQEASIFQEETVTSTLDIGRANRGLARRSLACPVLGSWWREGMKLVRVIE
ncbi:MAG: carbon-nitrogen hydrolase family protein [Phycisphaerales bacterium]|nr:carbon-nitrogen hydrolase family protein [Phycisphaerales bacterium]